MVVITPDDQASQRMSDDKVGPEEPPPAYSPPAELAPSVPSVTFKTKPTNFLALANENDAIRGEFVIDTSIRVPSSVLPPLGEHETEEDRKNLCLRSKSGSVQAEIWLLGSPGECTVGTHKRRRTTIALASAHGSIHAQLHTLDGAAPFSLTAHAPHGTVRLALPNSFHGLISLSTRHGSIALSDPLVQKATQLSQLGPVRRYFVGDFSLLGDEPWGGDQVEIEAVHGSIHVKYVDEAVDGQGRKGLLSRLFGY